MHPWSFLVLILPFVCLLFVKYKDWTLPIILIAVRRITSKNFNSLFDAIVLFKIYKNEAALLL